MIPVSFNGNNINDVTNYESLIELDAHGLPLIDVVTARRQGAWPIVGGLKRDERRINLQVFIRGASVDTLRTQLFQWFDYEDETPKPLIVEDTGGGNDRYVMAICRGIFPDAVAPETCYHIALVVDDDIRWRETSLTAPSVWNVTATGQTQAFTNNGQDDAYPIIKISPQGNKTASWPYKRFIPVKWRGQTTATNYPVDIANNSLDTQIASTNFALANGDDLRVWVNGVEIDRWFDGINTATTKVWVNFDWGIDVPMTLDGALTIDATSIQVNESINNMPSSGVIYIDTEAITYTSKSNATKTFNGCTRGAKGTTAATHTDTTAVFWLQHDIWVLYGNASAGAPAIDDDYKPMFSLANSSNTSWDYDEFREQDAWPPGFWNPRAGAWQDGFFRTADFYTGNQGSSADPAVEIGIYADDLNEQGALFVVNACGITAANFVNGEHKATIKIDFNFRIVSSLNTSTPNVLEYTIPDPASDGSWDTWSRNETLNSGSKAVGLLLLSNPFWDEQWCEAADVTLTLNSSYTPVTAIGAEQGNYSLACTITNNTTGKAIAITYSMDLNDEFEINTDVKTVIDLEDNSNQYKALDVVGDPRRDWLKLQVGSNTLQFDDTGTTDVDVTLTWEERHYQ